MLTCLLWCHVLVHILPHCSKCSVLYLSVQLDLVFPAVIFSTVRWRHRGCTNAGRCEDVTVKG